MGDALGQARPPRLAERPMRAEAARVHRAKPSGAGRRRGGIDEGEGDTRGGTRAWCGPTAQARSPDDGIRRRRSTRTRSLSGKWSPCRRTCPTRTRRCGSSALGPYAPSRQSLLPLKQSPDMPRTAGRIPELRTAPRACTHTDVSSEVAFAPSPSLPGLITSLPSPATSPSVNLCTTGTR